MRALCVSNLIAQDQKRYIGALSAYCGVVCAAAGAGAAITYLCGGDEEQIENTVINTIANIGGMVCDGAKPSCAAKISSALQSAILGHEMAMRGIRFEAGDGIVMENAEDTVKAIGYMGKWNETDRCGDFEPDDRKDKTFIRNSRGNRKVFSEVD